MFCCLCDHDMKVTQVFFDCHGWYKLEKPLKRKSFDKIRKRILERSTAKEGIEKLVDFLDCEERVKMSLKSRLMLNVDMGIGVVNQIEEDGKFITNFRGPIIRPAVTL
eukprot:TRINITY_DN2407_c0_g1_i1.p1 TRINITY_DN2407_c0_g1~~TRINITY_DN2407_c0_g1_i1.p1  ORF type:complete len:108 (+),score=2.54 TRINITY_DN2407_c0_g1_i1:73-396(+)